MKIVTNKLIHENVSYYDISSASAVLLKHLFGVDLTSYTKEQRLVMYGKLVKSLGIPRYCSWFIRTIVERVCRECDGIMYTQDSVVCSDMYKSKTSQITIFNFRKVWTARLLVISPYKKSYIALTTDGQGISKGTILINDILAARILKLSTEGKDPLGLKYYLKNTDEVDVFIKNNKVISYSGPSDPTNIDISRIDRNKYWIECLKYIRILKEGGYL